MPEILECDPDTTLDDIEVIDENENKNEQSK